MSPQKMRSLTRKIPKPKKLTEVAKYVCKPAGIVKTGFAPVEAKLAKIGIRFDEWQRNTCQLILGKRADGLYACGVGGAVLSIPRQVGKTYMVGWMVFALALLFPSQLIIWTAHRTRTSTETFNSMKAMANHVRVKPFVETVRSANGEQAIIFSNGSRILFGAREQGFGRGFAKVDVLVFDEAQILTESAVEDMLPATNAAANGLVLMMGTPPRPKDPGEVFAHRRAKALQGSKDTLYVEFSADEDVDPSKWGTYVDWEQIAKANPSYPHRTSRTAILRMREILSSGDSFRREALGVWDAVAQVSTVFTASEWGKCLDRETRRAGNVSFAVKFSVDGSHVALSAAVRTTDGRVLVDGIRNEPTSAGVDWLVEYLTEPRRLKSTAQIVIDGKGGLGYLIDRLRSAGVRRGALCTPSLDQVISAHSMVFQSVKSGELVHPGTEELTRQALHVQFRKIGTQGGFGWLAPDGESVALLDAATLAFWSVKASRKRGSASERKRGSVIL